MHAKSHLGCPICYPDRTQRLAAGRTAEELYQRTRQRLWELEHQHGYELHVVWGHELREQLKKDVDVRQLWQGPIADQIVRPLDPREDALRGGRTEPFKLHHVCAPDEEIVCIDIVSVRQWFAVIFHLLL
jgi:hypothetical protein